MVVSLRRHLHANPHLYGAAIVGVLVALCAPNIDRAVTRALLGWNVAVWLFLPLTLRAMARADHVRMRQVAEAREESEGVVLTAVIIAALASTAAIVVELAAARHGGWPHLALAGATIAGCWLLLPMLFTLNYAGIYYRAKPAGGLAFPGATAGFKPDYFDFLYFSYTIAVAAQTADVAITASPLRRLVLVHAIVSFGFNTAILALTINTAAQFL